MSKMNTPHRPAPDRPTLKPGAKDGIGKPGLSDMHNGVGDYGYGRVHDGEQPKK